MKLSKHLPVFIYCSFLFSFQFAWAQTETFVEHGLEITSYNDPKKFDEDFTNIWTDKDGQLWIANMETFRRFDGNSFEIYIPPVDKNSPKTNRQIRHAKRDEKGNLWLPTLAGGTVKYDPRNNTYTRVKVDSLSLFDDKLADFQIDSLGVIWAGGEQNLHKITDGEPFEIKLMVPSSPASDIKPLIDSLISTGQRIAEITEVSNNKFLHKTFEVKNDNQFLTVLAEGCLGVNEKNHVDGRLADFGWITNIKGDTVWKMEAIGSYPAGATFELIMDVDHIQLPKGIYELHYKSDFWVAYGAWKAIIDQPSFEPAVPEWYGIQVFKSNDKIAVNLDKTLNAFASKSVFATGDPGAYKDNDGAIWLVGHGIQKIVVDNERGFSFENYFRIEFTQGFPKYYVFNAMYPYDDENFLLTAYTFDLQCDLLFFNKKDKTLKKIKSPIEFIKGKNDNPAYYSHLSNLVLDKRGNIWTSAFMGSGLYKISPPFILEGEEGEPNITAFAGDGKFQAIRDLEIDKFNNLWVGTHKNYLHKINLDPLPFTEFNFVEASQLDTIIGSSILKDLEGNYWISLLAREGYKRNPGKNGPLEIPNHRSSILKLDARTGKFEEYMGSFENIGFKEMQAIDILPDGRIVFYDGKNLHFFDQKEGQIESYAANNLGKLEVGNRHLMINDSLLFVDSPQKPSVFNVYQNYLYQNFSDTLRAVDLIGRGAFKGNLDHDGKLYLFKEGAQGGVYQWENNKVNLERTNNLFELKIADVFVDRKDKLWLAGYQLFTDFDGQIFQTTISDPAIRHIFQTSTLMDDKDSNIWVFSDLGIAKYNPSTKAVYYPRKLQSLELDQFPGYRHRDGSISLRGKRTAEEPSGGVFYFLHPDSLTIDPIAPKLVFDYMQGAGENGADTLDLDWFPLEDFYEFDHDRSSITIRYKGIQFNDPEGINYSYRLKGSSDEWLDVGREQIARFLNLSAGDYNFELKAANGDGVWSEVSSLSFRINPPWWWSWWAKSIYALAAIGVLVYYLNDARKKVAEKEIQLQKEQALNQKLQQADKLKDEFLANTSHELRTPLNGIIGISDSLIEGAAGPINESMHNNLNLISNSGRRLSNLVNDILDFSKIRNKDLALNAKAVDLYAAVDVVLKLSQPLVEHKDLELINEVKKELPAVHADENRLQQILHNLIGNAIKFTEIGKVNVSAEEKEGEMQIHISDSGIGIQKENLNKIFNSFEQGDGSTARQFGGTGLGLAVTRQLVELHGGKIQVKSSVGEGSIFSFTLPLSTFAAENGKAVASIQPDVKANGKFPLADTKPSNGAQSKDDFIPAPIGRQFKVLVVDDEPVNLQVLENHLKMYEFEVTKASSGMQALEIMSADPSYDLMILDIMMPKMSGYEVCERLRELFMPHELPVVMLTAKNRVSDLVDGFSSGANDYLTKPFSKDELISRIKTHLELSQISKSYGRFVPHDFLDLIGKESIVYTHLGDQTAGKMTVMFSDIRSYTTLSEQMSPEENFKFINAYLKRVGPKIQDHQGFVNQFLGDGIMALFKGSPINALRAAIDMQKAIQHYNTERNKKGRKLIKTGIGLHSGDLMLGIIGDEKRQDTGVISDSVNTAARLEGLTKLFNAKIILSESSFAMIEEDERQQFQFRYLGQVQVKGRTQAIGIYECIDGEGEDIKSLKLESHELFKKGMELYKARDFSTAAGMFKSILEKNAEDKAAKFYLEKAAKFLVENVSDDWTGIIKLDQK